VVPDLLDVEAAAGPGAAQRWSGRLRNGLPVLGLLGLVAWFSSASPYFLDSVNATNAAPTRRPCWSAPSG
jgi:hypothetical protein